MEDAANEEGEELTNNRTSKLARYLYEEYSIY